MYIHIHDEISQIEQRIFTDELLQKLFVASQQEAQAKGLDLYDPETARSALEPVLGDVLKALLEKMEQHLQDSLKFCSRFSFHRGVFAAFQQFFTDTAPDQLFHLLVTKPLMAPDNDREKFHCAFPYFLHRDLANQACQKLLGQLDEDGQNSVLEIYGYWDERTLGVLRYGFYLGYRYAHTIIDGTAPVGALHQKIGQTLLTEYELGITLPQAEREAISDLTHS